MESTSTAPNSARARSTRQRVAMGTQTLSAPALREVAHSIGRRLCRDAIRSGGRCNWLGDSMEFVDNDWRVVHRNFGGDLYAGTSGIGLFLARLHALEPEPTYRATAEAAMRHAATAARAMDPGTAFGLYTGL